ncbi:hypothetical protein L218DRAFT_954733 [Marasmius fiardii PR-910]|nr:hypothetical protein L218DRAFT_954733 [Marasmius fiardii PR-910]
MSTHHTPSRQICRFFSERGNCKYGTSCRYSHDLTSIQSRSGQGAPRRGGPSGSGGRSTPPGSPNPRTGTERAPRGNCDFFWSTGQCNRGFDCTFRHVQKPGSGLDSTRAAENDSSPFDSLDFCTPEGLAQMNEIFHDHSLTPPQAHNEIKPFIHSSFTFTSSDGVHQMTKFAKVLASVDKRNSSWNSETAQSFLEMVVQSPALNRIRELLGFQEVSHRMGMGFSRLSFQRGFFPALQFFTSELILRSTLRHNINALYTALKDTFDNVAAVVTECVDNMVNVRSWKDPTPGLSNARLFGVVVFSTLSTLLHKYFLCFKREAVAQPNFVAIVDKLVMWYAIWAEDPSAFGEHLDASRRQLTMNELGRNVDRLQEIVQREHGTNQAKKRPIRPNTLSVADKRQALLTRLEQSYDPPGVLRANGLPRHDNDVVNISDIRIVPTRQELLSDVPPYLPVNIFEAPHHCAEGSMDRHVDTHFRLLREELIAPIRDALAILQMDFTTMANRHNIIRPGDPFTPTQIEQIKQRNGGLYRSSGYNSVTFQVYTDVEFAPVEAQRRELTVGLIMDAPPVGHARSNDRKVREDYWKRSKRLASGSLVCLLISRNGDLSIYPGIVLSTCNDIAQSAKVYDLRIEIRARFFDPDVEVKAIRRYNMKADRSSFALLIDNNIMFESIRPFLETLQSAEPTSIPFYRYISQHSELQNLEIYPPKYALSPRFRFSLECLATDGAYIHPLDATDPLSIRRARLQLKDLSYLDESQCDAMVDVLTREVALIQGPPGTGKSFTGKEILRVLFKSKVKPVILIAFTNHALDHMLLSLLDSGITENFVRMGSRSSDERIAEYTLDKLEQSRQTNSDRSVGKAYREMKALEKEMASVLTNIQVPDVKWPEMQEFLESRYPEQSESLLNPPYWIEHLLEPILDPDQEGGEWNVVRHKNPSGDKQLANTRYGLWKHGYDIEFITPPSLPDTSKVEDGPRKEKGKQIQTKRGKKKEQNPDPTKIQEQAIVEHVQRLSSFFEALGFDTIPPIPEGRQPLSDLLSIYNVWSLSSHERLALARAWEKELREDAYDKHLNEYNSLRKDYEEVCRRYNDVRDESRRRLISRVDLIGCTTTGAAKLTSLLATLSPKVVLVEEAGQVLEAHILASLVPSVEHLICIGDPQQLRATLANYNLSMDSERGRELYKLDRSLMERLADNGLPMSMINVQRRMRPSISHHIRNILYPRLEDHDNVTQYPSVSGMEKDIFFFSHMHREDGAEDSVSKTNQFEVSMIVDLVKYFLQQDVYSAPGDIAVLCAYLGQLHKVRAAMRDLKIAVSLDDRDAKELDKQGMEEDAVIEQVAVARHIRLGTVDVFQGEEAKIVIVSLVRNSGTPAGDSVPIGFLKSSNRINVALSRAQHGLYILGNAFNLRQNGTWRTIIDEMEAKDEIGYALPICCPRHPDQKAFITEPGQLSQRAPLGGCTLPCDHQMPCGHKCQSVCHPDRNNHRGMRCDMPCLRTPCPRSHPCERLCSDDCGRCEFPLSNVTLPCGHIAKSVPCYRYDDRRNVECKVLVEKKLPNCEHKASMNCSTSPENAKCPNVCGGVLPCCGRSCKSKCGDCTAKTRESSPGAPPTKAGRTSHKSHPCERTLYCQHLCGLDCSQDHECNTYCRQPCRQRCGHHECPQVCAVDCAPCAEPCEWVCAHFSCPVLCGSICARLPCDKPCLHPLKCGHRCPSVCGEPCSDQTCVECLPTEAKADIVDFLMQRTLAEIDMDLDETSDRLITLRCGHIFTVETLDGHCHMSDYYEVDPNLGTYLGMKAPPVDFQHPPTCPTCRSPITARRYGRVVKRANLDILEQNVASNMAKRLEDLGPTLQIIAAELPELKEKAQKLSYQEAALPIEDLSIDSRTSLLGQKLKEIMPYSLLSRNGMTQYHGISNAEGKEWFMLIQKLFNLYKKVEIIAKTRSSHVRAYQAALTTLFREELIRLSNGSMPGNVNASKQQAMDNAHKNIGQPPHKADVRYYIEAFLLSVELRFMLGEIAGSRIEGLTITSNDEQEVNHHRLWSSFVEFLYHSCEVDCQKAVAIAESSSSSRLAARSTIQGLCASFELFRFSLLQKRKDFIRAGRIVAARDELLQEIRGSVQTWKGRLRKAEETYMRSRPSKTMEELVSERQWFSDNCRVKLDRVLQEVAELEKHIKQDTIYQPVSLQEKEDIVKAFGFTHRGHFYNCPNGHTFVIADCGGATTVSRCPECGAVIGGSNHTLHSSNTRALEFEDIARNQGAQTSPWGWGAGV